MTFMMIQYPSLPSRYPMTMRLLTCLLLISFSCLAYTQSGRVLQYGREAGLARNDVTAVHQDVRGVLWVGTRGAGLYRLSQGRFQQGIEVSSTLGFDIFDLESDADGRLYIACAEGVFRYDGVAFLQVLDATRQVVALHRCAQKMYGASAEQLIRLDDGDVVYKGAVWAMWCNFEPTWLTDLTIEHINGSSEMLPEGPWIAMASAEDHGYWIANQSGAIRHVSKGDVRLFQSGIENITCLLVTGTPGELWVGSNNGLFFVNTNDSLTVPVRDPNDFLADAIQTMSYDDQDRLWIGTNTHGLLQYLGEQTFRFNSATLDPNSNMNLKQSNGMLYTGGQLFEAIHGQLDEIPLPAILSQDDITDAITDHLGRRWVNGSTTGIYLGVDSQWVAIDTVITPRIRNIVQMCVTLDGTLYVEQEGKRGFLLGIEIHPVVKLPQYSARSLNFMPSDRCVDLIPRKDGTVLRIGSTGIGIIREVNYVHHSDLDHSILSAALDDYGMLWIGTEAGGIYTLDLVSDDAPQRLISPFALQPYDIHYILPRARSLWIGTRRTVMALQLDSARTSVQRASEVYRTREDMSTGDFGSNAGVLIVTEGVRATGITMGGPPRPSMPPVFISQVHIGQQSIDQTEFAASVAPFNRQLDPLQLPFAKNDLSFSFEAAVTDATQLTYQWRLSPQYPEWSNASSHGQVQLAGLAPGDYTFEARVCARGDCSELPEPWRFRIHKAIWHNWWFWAAIAVISGIILFTWVRWRERRIQGRAEQEKAQLRERLRAVTLEQKALALQMQPHFIFNALQTIQNQIDHARLDIARTNLGQYGKLMRMMLSMSRAEKVTLEDELDFLQAYVDVENMCRQQPVTFMMEVDKELELFAIDIPPMLIQPLVENAIKHGAGNAHPVVQLRVTMTGRRLSLIVQDNGEGFEAAGSATGTSTAIAIIRERLQFLGKGTHFSLSFVAPGEQMKGTRAEIRLPIDQ